MGLYSLSSVSANITTSEYKIFLRSPQFLVDLGTKEKPNYVPAELCQILPNQPFRGKLSDNHTAAMIKYACNRPSDNARSIVHQGLPFLGLTGTDSPALDAFGVTVSSEMAVVPARILDPPQLLYSQNKPADVKRDKASWNLQNRRFFKGQPLENWGVYLVITGSRSDFANPQDPELIALVKAFQNSCLASGMRVENLKPGAIRGANITSEQNNSNALHKKLLDSIGRLKSCSFLLVILSNADKRVYATVRRVCDVELGIPATCVQSTKIRNEKGQLQYMANVALKINAKLGGLNHTLDGVSSKKWLSSGLTMLVGMDVTHPGYFLTLVNHSRLTDLETSHSPGSAKGTPSIAGVVGKTFQHLFVEYWSLTSVGDLSFL